MKKLLLALTAIFGFTLSHAQIQNYNVGDVVTDFTVTDIHGNTHNLYTYTSAGKHVFLDFFFTTCPPCQSTSPIFNEFYDKYGCNENDVICIAINTGQDNDAAVLAYENQYGGSFNHAPAVSGDGGSATVDNDLNPTAYPTYCIIGPDNKLKSSDIWPISSVASFEAAFPSGFNPQPKSCTTVGLEESEIASFSMYPNPNNNGLLHVTVTSTSADVDITIVDITGKQVHNSLHSTANTIVINHQLPAGTYVVSVTTENSTAQQKLVVL